MRIIRIAIGAILFFISIYYLLQGSLVEGAGFMLFFGLLPLTVSILIFKGVGFLQGLSVLFGAIAIFNGLQEFIGSITLPEIFNSYAWLIGIMGIVFVFPIGILVILPLKFYKNSFIQKSAYFFSTILIVLVLAFIFNFLPQQLKDFRGGFAVIPILLSDGAGIFVDLLLIGIFCLPFLIIKSLRSKKIKDFSKINN